MRKKLILLIIIFSFIILSVLTLKIRANFLAEKENEQPMAEIALSGNNIILPSSDFVLGQNFIVGIFGKTFDEKTKEFLQQIKPAGVILYSRNYESYEQLKNLIAELQAFAKETTGYNYFIMIDEEPGGATRLNIFKNVFAFGFPEWERIEQDIKGMASVGINVNLAPLADFPFEEDTFIKKRIQAYSPEALMDFNRKFINLMQENYISATLKHFPGMGVFIDDPHKKLSFVSVDQKIIDKSIKIFKDGIDAGVHFVMTAHGVYDDIDPDVPATLSKKITTNILRENLGFEGLIITDDLSDMPFIVGREIDLAQASVESLKAGHNLIIFSHGKMKEIFEKLILILENDKELKHTVEQNYRRIITFKKEHYKDFNF